MIAAKHALNLTQYHFRRFARGFVVYGTWLRHDEIGRPPEPCLAILAVGSRHGHEHCTPVVVPLSTGYLWAPDSGDGRHCARASVRFLKTLGMPVDARNGIQLTLAIQDHLGDLLTIPPFVGEAVVVADAIRTDQYGKRHHAEIVERV